MKKRSSSSLKKLHPKLLKAMGDEKARTLVFSMEENLVSFVNNGTARKMNFPDTRNGVQALSEQPLTVLNLKFSEDISIVNNQVTVDVGRCEIAEKFAGGVENRSLERGHK